MKGWSILVRHSAVFLCVAALWFYFVPSVEAGDPRTSKNGWDNLSISVFFGIPTVDMDDLNAWIDEANANDETVSVPHLESDYEWGMRISYSSHPQWRVGLAYTQVMVSSDGSTAFGPISIEAPANLLEVHLLHLFMPERSLNFGAGISAGFSRVKGRLEGALGNPNSPTHSVETFTAGSPVFSGYGAADLRLGSVGSAVLEAGWRFVDVTEAEGQTFSYFYPDGRDVMISHTGFFIRVGLRLTFAWIEFG